MNKENQSSNEHNVSEHSAGGTISVILIILAFIAVFADLFFIATTDSNVDMNMYIGVGAFPAIGLFLITPVIILSAIRESRRLHKVKHADKLQQEGVDGFYETKTTPFDFSRKLITTILRRQLSAAFIVIAIIIGLFLASLNNLESSYSKVSDGAGLLILGVLIFGIPAFAYFLTRLILRIRIVRRKSYDSCHAVVTRVDANGVHLAGYAKHAAAYEHGFCVGVRKREINDTPATLVFILDEVYIIPDSVASQF